MMFCGWEGNRGSIENWTSNDSRLIAWFATNVTRGLTVQNRNEMPNLTLVSSILRIKILHFKFKFFKTLLCGILPDEDCDDGGVPGDADNADYGDVHSEGVNEPVRGRLDDVTVAQPMIVQIRSAVSVTFIPRDRIG